jgi:hypothetical protein
MKKPKFNLRKALYCNLVVRSDAGGQLYAPVQIIDNKIVETTDITPTYNREAMERQVRIMNARRTAALKLRTKGKVHA